jgi:hypothetical protein
MELAPRYAEEVPMLKQHSTVTEGLLVGALGAATVALWFMVVDIIAGEPFHTPISLGGGLLGLAGISEAGMMTQLLSYSVFHYGAFAVVGILAAYSTHLSERFPVVLALFVPLFVTFQLGFYGITAVLAVTDFLGTMAWYQIAIGNLLATAVMGGFLWQTHPVIRTNLDVALSS